MAHDEQPIHSIEHAGVITAITDEAITVALEKITACGSCHAYAMCKLAHTDSKSVEISNPHRQYAVGDSVIVTLARTSGVTALFLAYVLPFIIMVAVLFVASAFTDSEVIAGLTAMATLIPYYVILHLYRHRLKRAFTFYIKP